MTDQPVTGATLVADLERKPESLARLAEALADPGLLAAVPAHPRRVVLTGMGSSRYAAEVAALRLRAAGLDAVAEVASAASGWSPGPDVLVLAISATGGSVETLAALERYRGARIVGITEAPDSPLGRAADAIVPLLAGREVSGVACRTFQHSLLVLRAIEAYLTGVSHDTLACAARRTTRPGTCSIAGTSGCPRSADAPWTAPPGCTSWPRPSAGHRPHSPRSWCGRVPADPRRAARPGTGRTWMCISPRASTTGRCC